jgi:hypothetical protein
MALLVLAAIIHLILEEGGALVGGLEGAGRAMVARVDLGLVVGVGAEGRGEARGVERGRGEGVGLGRGTR